jgi:nucleotide-binding universal stress UspA family protein
MALPKSILYPVDFSARCEEIRPCVEEMSRTLHAPVTMLHVRGAGMEEDFDREAMWLGAIEVVEGGTVDSILKCAAALEEPMIMMPTRGHGQFRSLLLGSVTAGVLHGAPWPVWTDAHREGHEAHSGTYRSVLCAVDLSPRTADLLCGAKEFCEAFGASLHVVHAVPGVDPRFSSGVASRAHEFLMAEARDRFPAYCKGAGFDAPFEIVEDVGLGAGIARAAMRHSADLLIVARGAMHGTLGRLRTNAHELIRSSPCPVLSL